MLTFFLGANIELNSCCLCVDRYIVVVYMHTYKDVIVPDINMLYDTFATAI